GANTLRLPPGRISSPSRCGSCGLSRQTALSRIGLVMPSEALRPITQLLQQWRAGDVAALEELGPLVYGEPRRLAGAYLRRERAGHSLQPTDLVHEAFVRLIRQDTPDYQNRAHFLAIAAE